MVQFPRPLGDCYELLAHIGMGGMCDVYRGRQLDLDRLVAIKVPREEQCDKVQIERLLREAKTCARLRHPNIVAVYDVDKVDELPFIAMELVEGKTLFDLLHQEISLKEGLAIILEVTKALEYAHGLGVVHRDLKPGNVLIGKEEQVRVADWGLARAHEDKAGLTKTGLIMGTPQYIAPEQVIEGQCDGRADLYALGTMLFELCARRLPFDNEDPQMLVVDKIKENAPPLRTFFNGPAKLIKLIDGLLSQDPELRPKGKQVIATLEEIVQPKAFKSENNESNEKKKKEKRKNYGAAALVILLIVLSLLANFYGQHNEEQKILRNLSGVTLQQPSLKELSLQVSVALKGELQVFVHYEQEKIAEKVFLDLSAQKTKGNRRHLDLDLKKPLLGQGRVVLKNGPVSYEHSLDGGRVVKRFFDRIAGLQKNKESWRTLVNELEEARTRLYQNKDQENFAEVLKTCRLAIYAACDKAGFDKEFRRSVKEVLPKVFARQTIYPGSEMAQKLRPLQIMEALLSENRIFKLDWGYVSGLLGMRFFVKDERPKEVLATIETKEIVHNKEKWLYMSDERYLKSFRQTKFLRNVNWARLVVRESHVKNAQLDTSKEAVPGLKKMRTHWRSSFTFDKPDNWPRKIRFELLVRRFVHYATINVSINGKPSMLIVNTVVLSKQAGQCKDVRSAVWTLWTSMPLDPELLRQGANTISLTVKDIWPLEATAVMAIGGIRIVSDD